MEEVRREIKSHCGKVKEKYHRHKRGGEKRKNRGLLFVVLADTDVNLPPESSREKPSSTRLCSDYCQFHCSVLEGLKQIYHLSEIIKDLKSQDFIALSQFVPSFTTIQTFFCCTWYFKDTVTIITRDYQQQQKNNNRENRREQHAHCETSAGRLK